MALGNSTMSSCRTYFSRSLCFSLVSRGCTYPGYMNNPPPILPFFIPFRAMTNRDYGNLLVGGKTMAQSFLANAGDQCENSAQLLDRQHLGCTRLSGAQGQLLVSAPLLDQLIPIGLDPCRCCCGLHGSERHHQLEGCIAAHHGMTLTILRSLQSIIWCCAGRSCRAGCANKHHWSGQLEARLTHMAELWTRWERL
jgi:hypothetical protein